MRSQSRHRSRTSSASTIRDEEATVSASDRIRRPPLDRTEPIRAWSSLFGAGPLNDVVTRSVDLGPDAAGRRLVVHGLRAVDPAKPRLADVSIVADGDQVTVRVRVPPDVPAAVYNGLIVDEETSRPAGTVSVRIAP